MESVSLQDFVSETLKAIAVGVADAQQYSKDKGAIPIALFSVGGEKVQSGEQLVKFSISVQAERSAETTGKAEAGATIISVITGRVEVGKSVTASNQHIHSVEFSVPIHFNSRWPEVEIK